MEAHELLQRAARGDAEAFGDFYEQLLDRVYRYAYYRLGNERDAEDLTEETFVRAWEALRKTGRVPDHPEAWIFRIAHNLIVDHHRAARPETELTSAPPLPDRGPGPEEQVQQRETLKDLLHHLRRLPPQWQQVLVCRFIQGMSHAETAKVLGIAEGHVRVLQYRALRRLREMLQSQEVEHHGTTHSPVG
ncbi:MAG TPA: sigma-70 family RNA polymerase sigma factor [Anaerolineae bacterium]|nr:sigma-70 family RNA polymerase sigma factor [Anaerolineae bacterium]HID84228.1 sigma-70 family RNA polymerase sigma factor [Anaerolineales bacterium]HIQ08936.1 sigma-70 family RNA polymerase sigma factor [Anaerolineaceae bacterium]